MIEKLFIKYINYQFSSLEIFFYSNTFSMNHNEDHCMVTMYVIKLNFSRRRMVNYHFLYIQNKKTTTKKRSFSDIVQSRENQFYHYLQLMDNVFLYGGQI